MRESEKDRLNCEFLSFMEKAIQIYGVCGGLSHGKSIWTVTRGVGDWASGETI